MTTVHLIEYADATPAVRAVYDDIRATRNTDFINNFWKAMAVNPEQLSILCIAHALGARGCSVGMHAIFAGIGG